MMLRAELTDADIPKRTTVRARIRGMFEAHLIDIAQEIKVKFR